MNFKKQTLTFMIQALCVGSVFANVSQTFERNNTHDESKYYQIAESRLGYVLSTFAAQSGVVLSYDPVILKNLNSQGLKGRYSVEQGFKQILRDTPFNIGKRGETYILVPKEVQLKQSDLSGAKDLMLPPESEEVPRLQKIVVTAQKNRLQPNTIQLDSEHIQRFRGTGNGDVFSDVTGVQLNSIRNEAGAIDIGIRGVQGEGRVPVVIDGSLQSTHTFRGYQGESDRTYIDMDLVSKISIEKGASTDKFAVGGIGGLVKVRTIGVDDVLLPDKQAGMLIKGSIYNNNKTPKISTRAEEQEHYLLTDRLSQSHFNNGSGTVAFAYKTDLFDIVTAYSKRSVGNYFAGKNGYERYKKLDADVAVVNTGQEVVNTSYESDSGIVKFGINLTDEQRIEANFRRHIQHAGEVMAAYWYKHYPDDGTGSAAWYAPDGREAMPQWGLGKAAVNSYSTSYHYHPKNNAWVNLDLGFWKTDAKLNQRNGLASGMGKFADQYLISYQDDRIGFNVENTSKFSMLPLSLHYGATYDEQRVKPQNYYKNEVSRNGERSEASVFLNSSLEFAKWNFNLGGKWHQAKVKDYSDDSTRKFDAKLDWIAGLKYKIHPNIDAYTKISNTYRTPSLFESTISGQTFSYDPDFPLNPEKAENKEIGFVGNFEHLFSAQDQFKFNLNYFHNNTQDYVSQVMLYKPDPEAWYPYSFTFANYKRVLLKGVELDFLYNHPSFFVTAGGMLYEKPEICPVKSSSCNTVGDAWSLISTRIPPRKTFNFTVGKYLFDQNLTVGARVKYHSYKEKPKGWLEGTGVSGRAVINVPSETLLDIFAKYKLNSHVDVSLNLDNLTNRYAFDTGSVIAMPIPGRTIRAGFEMRF
nr:TonB-dependent receptor [Acinetobacter sp. Marseille-Q1620]